MTKKQYTSPTGLYSIRLGADLIHEGITSAQVAYILEKYEERYNDETIAWPYDPSKLKVEEFSGTYLLKSKR